MMPATHPFVKALVGGLGRCGVAAGDRLLLAVSGGADSVALLAGCAALAGRREWQLDLHAGHVNHHLRPSADDEAAAVAAIAGQFNVPCAVRDIRPPNNEAAARRLRYGALMEIAEQIDADAIVTAHHADDQLETMLMRLVRGASVRGLSGIRPRRRMGDRVLIRPLLRVTHEDAVAACRDAGLTWCEDESNDDRSKWRSRLRHEVLPVLRDLRADAAMKAADTAAAAADAAEVVDRHAAALIEQHVAIERDRAMLSRHAARQLTATDRRLLVVSVSRRMGVPTDRLPARTVREIARAVGDKSNDCKRFELSAGVLIKVAADEVTWQQIRP